MCHSAPVWVCLHSNASSIALQLYSGHFCNRPNRETGLESIHPNIWDIPGHNTVSRSSDLDFLKFFLNAFVIENGGIRVACVLLQSVQHSVCYCVFGSEQRQRIQLPVCAPAGCLLGRVSWTIEDTHTHIHQMHALIAYKGVRSQQASGADSQ